MHTTTKRGRMVSHVPHMKLWLLKKRVVSHVPHMKLWLLKKRVAGRVKKSTPTELPK